jgi:hypothetical protein
MKNTYKLGTIYLALFAIDSYNLLQYQATDRDFIRFYIYGYFY